MFCAAAQWSSTVDPGSKRNGLKRIRIVLSNPVRPEPLILIRPRTRPGLPLAENFRRTTTLAARLVSEPQRVASPDPPGSDTEVTPEGPLECGFRPITKATRCLGDAHSLFLKPRQGQLHPPARYSA